MPKRLGESQYPDMASSASDVFVSYSAADRERVRPLVAALEAAGLTVWWDIRIAPGAGFDAEIQAALDDARCVLVIWSQSSVVSEWVITEANEGLERTSVQRCAVLWNPGSRP